MKSISIVGFGRFGKTLYRLLENDFSITLYNRSRIDDRFTSKNTHITKRIADVYKNEVIFYAVPIAAFERVIKTHRKYFTEKHLLIDVLSVKLHPAHIFQKYLRNISTQALLTHPMFGPDSSENGFAGLPLIIDKFMTDEKKYQYWKNYFYKKELRVVEMSAREHDQLAANSQGITHFIGRLLEEYNFTETAIDSLGAKKLLEIKEQTCNDTWELFTGLQQYNPYTRQMRIRLGKAYGKLYNKLLPKRNATKYIVFGIQGGQGSFNEEAVYQYCNKHAVKKYRVKYLYTSKNVLAAIHRGDIDFGLFAIQNATGGLVAESVVAMAKYTFQIVEEFSINIRHCLMRRTDIATEKIQTIMAHPQNFRQCTITLQTQYPCLKQISGTGDLIDTAKAAQKLAEGKLPKTVAILGPRLLQKKYGFRIIAENLQDKEENFTTFLLITR